MSAQPDQNEKHTYHNDRDVERTVEVVRGWTRAREVVCGVSIAKLIRLYR